MNLIRFEKMEAEKGWYLLRDFRKYDYNKIQICILNMLKNLKNIRPEFNCNLTIKNADSNYHGGFSHKMDKIQMDLQLGKFLSKTEVEVPKLVNDNTFMLNGSLYVPILFLERAPIDRVGTKAEKKNKILLNIPTQPIIFDWKAKTVKLNKKLGVELSVFFKSIFYDEVYKDLMDSIYLEFGRPTNGSRELTWEECKHKVLEGLGITGMDRFKNMNVDEFFDKYILLDYFKELFFDYYGQSNFKDIIRVVLKYYQDDIEINMADVRNRRIVMTEYLMHPIFEWYHRFLYNFIDSDYKEYLIPNLNSNCIISEGFRERMHGEQLFNITLPYITPIVHKVSQAIIIISGKVPKKWTSNHPSAMGIFCPISVSAQDMGQNLVATLGTEINFYGRLKSFTMPNPGTLYEIPNLIPTGNLLSTLTKKGNLLVDSETGEIIKENNVSEIKETTETIEKEKNESIGK